MFEDDYGDELQEIRLEIDNDDVSDSHTIDRSIDAYDDALTLSNDLSRQWLKPKTKCVDRKSTRLNSSHIPLSRMPSSA